MSLWITWSKVWYQRKRLQSIYKADIQRVHIELLGEGGYVDLLRAQYMERESKC